MSPAQKTIWINKTSASKHLSRSEGTEKKKIFSHVQRTTHLASAHGRSSDRLSDRGHSSHALTNSNTFVEAGSHTSRLSSTSSHIPDRTLTRRVRLHSSSLRHVQDPSLYAVNPARGTEESDVSERPIEEKSVTITLRKPASHGFDPLSRVYEPSDAAGTWQELRFLQFFREKTAVEWSGWHDTEFWHRIAPQLARSHPVVKHALVSLGAFRASFEAEDAGTRDKNRALSLRQAAKSIAGFNRDYEIMSMTAIFISSIALTAMASCIDIFTFLHTMRVEFQLMDQVRSQMIEGVSTLTRTDRHIITNYLEPLIERQRSREGRILDSLYALSVAPATSFYVSQVPNVPTVFNTLWQARQTLEELLQWTTYTVKTQNCPVNEIPSDAEYLVHRWLHALESLHQRTSLTEDQTCSWLALRASCRMAVMMIRTMSSPTEMVFDSYHSEFRELLTAFTTTLAHRSRHSATNIVFGIDSGFVALVFQAARWCRDPVLRRQLIASLATANRSEHSESGHVAAAVSQCYAAIEEVGIIDPTPPTCAADIPSHARIRPYAISFYCVAKVLRVQYLRWPYVDIPRDLDEVWIPHGNDGTQIQYAAVPVREGGQPDFALGRGYSKYLMSEREGDYYTVDGCRFYFSIPRV